VLVGGRFKVDRPIARGGMGEVWAGEHCATGMRVALKVLLPEMSTNADVIQRFEREAMLLGRVRSDRVARMIDFLFDPKWGAVLVTEFVDGPSLAEAQGPAPMSVEGAVHVGLEVARALRDLHRAHIVHRDLKPGNVILQPLEDGRSRGILVDLGVSRFVPPTAGDTPDALTDITKTHIVLGTIGYMAPEQILGPREVTASADLYGLGAILFRMVRGHNVFDGLSQLEQLRSKLQGQAPPVTTGRTDPLARGFEGVVARALQREPHLRYASADEMIAALSALPSASSGASAAPRSGSAQSRGRRHLGRALRTAIVAIPLAACGMGVMHRMATTPPPPSLPTATDPALGTARQSAPPDRVEAAADRSMCMADEPPAKIAPAPSKDVQAPTATRVDPASASHNQNAHDEALLRAMRRAVQDEAYLTLTIPGDDEVPEDWIRWAAGNAVLATARR
jgi:serine/threonine-protein kinase